MKVASVFMGSLIFPRKDVVYVCVCARTLSILFLVFNNFVLLLVSFHLLIPTCLARLSYSIHLFIYFGLCLFGGGYLLICLFASLHMCAFRSIIFISSSYVCSSYSRFMFACVPDQCTKCHLCRPKRRQQ